jgi:hypothetical protein
MASQKQVALVLQVGLEMNGMSKLTNSSSFSLTFATTWVGMSWLDF